MVADKAREYYDKAAKERQKLSQGRGQKGVESLPHLNETGKARDAAAGRVTTRQRETPVGVGDDGLALGQFALELMRRPWAWG